MFILAQGGEAVQCLKHLNAILIASWILTEVLKVTSTVFDESGALFWISILKFKMLKYLLKTERLTKIDVDLLMLLRLQKLLEMACSFGSRIWVFLPFVGRYGTMRYGCGNTRLYLS